MVTNLRVINNISYTNRLEKGQCIFSALLKLFSLFIKGFVLQISFLPLLMSLLPGTKTGFGKKQEMTGLFYCIFAQLEISFHL